MAVEEHNGADQEETLAIGISFGNSNSGIAYTTSVRKIFPGLGGAGLADRVVGGQS